jgi:kynureninase
MEYAPGAARWLNGTPVIPALYACAEGVKIIRAAGIEAIRQKSVRQIARVIEMAQARGYRVFAPKDPSKRGGTITIDVPHAYEVSQVLLSRDILVDYRVGAGIRVAPFFFTRDDEIDTFFGSIDEALETSAWERFAGRQSVVT